MGGRQQSIVTWLLFPKQAYVINQIEPRGRGLLLKVICFRYSITATPNPLKPHLKELKQLHLYELTLSAGVTFKMLEPL